MRSSLNHPNIAAIYGIEQSGDRKFLVMELAPGETLAERIKRGPLPIDEALPIAKQIADGLEAAHEKGIIHRDLKPANIKVTPQGQVKVLDFGLAKAFAGEGAEMNLSNSPTLSMAATKAGVILGTAAYMSPEQAKGKETDRTTDIWAFGCVFYEMLTGRAAFEGETLGEILGSVFKTDPDWKRLPVETPKAIRRLLGRCLQKDRNLRLRDVGDARLEILEPRGEIEPAARQGKGREPLAWIVAAAAMLIALVFAIPTVRHLRETLPPAPPETRLDIVTPATDDLSSFALSPDGRLIVFAASGDGGSRLWLRSLATTTAQPLAGTEGATFPFWAPDGRAIGFFNGNALKRLDLGGNAPQILAPAVNGQGGTWNADGVIVFAPSQTTPLMRVSVTGGAATAVTTLGPQQGGHLEPDFLPDGRRFLFRAYGGPDVTGIYLGALDGSAPVRLIPFSSAVAYLPSGWLLWVRAGTLVAQRLDLVQAALTGEPVTLADRAVAVSVAATGLVAYRTAAGRQRQLTWVDRSGTTRGAVGQPDASLSTPRVVPHGRRVVVVRSVQNNQDLWLLDGTHTSRFTFDNAQDYYPLWSPDGTRIVFRSLRTGQGDLYQKLSSGAGVEELLVASDQGKAPTSWSADGRFLLYQSNDPQSNGDLWVVPMAGDRMPSVFLKTPFREVYGEFSPDGRWVAYQSDESGRMEIYIRPFVPPGAAGSAAGVAGGELQVSTAGGIYSLWQPDGKELYYLNPAGVMMAAPITVTGSTLEPGAPVVLFPTRIVGGGVDAQQGRQFDVAPDGRFLINTVLDDVSSTITLLENWKPPAK